MIEVKNLTKIYKMGKETVVALNNVSLNIDKGEFVAIVGPSGSGKSTIMHIIGGLDSPTEGHVYFDNKDISKYKDKEKAKFRNSEIGFVFQAFNLENTQTALENVMMPLIFSGSSKKNRKSKAGKALELVELGHLKKHKPNEMSGGQRQRVSIARALVNDPKIIFADEPTGNLDSKTSMDVMGLMKSLSSKFHQTLVVVTHNDEIAQMADRIVRIEDGRIYQGR